MWTISVLAHGSTDQQLSKAISLACPAPGETRKTFLKNTIKTENRRLTFFSGGRKIRKDLSNLN